MQLHAATIQNATGGAAIVFLQVGTVVQAGVPAGASVTIAAGATSPAQTGTVLTIDVARPAVAPQPAVHLSFDLHGQLPAVTATDAGSPYRLTLVQGGTALRVTYALVIADRAGTQIARLAPA